MSASIRSVVSMRTVSVIFTLFLALVSAGCTATERGAVAGGAGGALISRATGGSTLAGALIGGTAGALLGYASERNRTCRYRYRGRIYVERCPRGYR